MKQTVAFIFASLLGLSSTAHAADGALSPWFTDGVSDLADAQTDVNLTPLAPAIVAWSDFNPTIGYGVVQFQVPVVSVSGRVLKASDVSYRLLVNDEPYIYHAASNPLPGGAMEAEWIPVDYEDYDIKIEDGYHYLFFFFEGSQNLAVQSRYVAPDGREWLSGTADNEVEGVCETESDADVVRIVRYGLDGRELPAEAKGVVIEKLVRSDGSVSSRKILY